jgi:hypothetical protein
MKYMGQLISDPLSPFRKFARWLAEAGLILAKRLVLLRRASERVRRTRPIMFFHLLSVAY